MNFCHRIRVQVSERRDGARKSRACARPARDQPSSGRRTARRILAQIAASLLSSSSTLNLMPRRNDPISPGATQSLPNSVKIRISSSCGTKSARRRVDEVAGAHERLARRYAPNTSLRGRLAAAGEVINSSRKSAGALEAQRIPARRLARLDFVERPRRIARSSTRRPVVHREGRSCRARPESLGARARERSSEITRIQALGRTLRRVLPDRQGAGHASVLCTLRPLWYSRTAGPRLARARAGRDDHRLAPISKSRVQPAGALLYSAYSGMQRPELFLLAHCPE